MHYYSITVCNSCRGLSEKIKDSITHLTLLLQKRLHYYLELFLYSLSQVTGKQKTKNVLHSFILGTVTCISIRSCEVSVRFSFLQAYVVWDAM